VSLTPQARKSGIKKSNFFANTKHNLKRLLARESGAQGGLFDEKNQRSKLENLVTLSLQVPLVF
jgi:hypothetical protein